MAVKNEKQIKKYRIIIILQVLLLVTVVATGSLFVYDYTEHDPTFCTSCHIMRPAFKAWKTSIHQGIECHDCHYATVLERNQMLLKTIVEKPTQVGYRPHEKIIVPATMCIKCHWGGEDKKVPQISESTGHAMHWFKGSIECTSCHAIKLHQFGAEQKLCVNCHPKAKLILTRMKDMACTDCHNFRRGALVPGATVCARCHLDRLPPPPGKDRSIAHRQFDCMTCHHTHDPGRPADAACRNCHLLTMKRGKHPVHLETLDGDCLACHQPHRWYITKEESGTLCSQCHDLYPLKSFN